MKPSGLTVSVAPHVHCGNSISRCMNHQLYALIPASLVGVYFFGWRAAVVILTSMATAMAAELVLRKSLKKEVTVADGSAALAGLLFALLLPANTPLWIVVIGAALSMIIGKWVFGGLGAYPFNPTLIGLAMVRISWPAEISRWPVPAPFGITDALPIQTTAEVLKKYGVDMASQFSTFDALLGNQAGGIGAVAALALIAGGIYLIARGFISWHIPVGFIAGIILLAGVFRISDPGAYACPISHLLMGSTLLGVFFLAPEYTTSPCTVWGKLLYGFGCGLLVILIRVYGKYPDGVLFAILLMNLMTPIFDRIRPKVIGTMKEAQADG